MSKAHWIAALAVLVPLSASAQSRKPAPKKRPAEVEREWQNIRYYQARFAEDQKTHEEERSFGEKIRLVQNLPVAQDGDTQIAGSLPTEDGAAPTSGPVDTASLLAAEKKRLEDEKRARELEAAKKKLLDDKRDDSGQIIDEDPTAKKDNKRRGFFKRLFGRDDPDQEKRRRLDEDE